ncbi:MAG: hypothetical protein R2799_13755 [Crocinitomicaceae bacterium]
MKTLFTLAVFAAFLVACNSEEPKKDSEKESNVQDTVVVDTTLSDTLSEDSLEAQGYDIKEEEKIEENIEKKYGEQWEFCDCIVRNDSVNKALETADDAQVDKIIARMDVIEKHCKKMLTVPNNTPEERTKYQRKVNKCLRQNGLK